MIPELGRHAFAVLAAYGAGLGGLAALCLVTWLQARRAARTLAAAQARKDG